MQPPHYNAVYSVVDSVLRKDPSILQHDRPELMARPWFASPVETSEIFLERMIEIVMPILIAIIQ